MGETIADTPRYAAAVARYRELLGGLVGSASMVAAAEASPDATLIAVLLRITDALEGRGHTELHLVTTDGSRHWPVTGADVDAADPRWTREGTRLVFLADIGSRHRPAPFTIGVGTDGPIGEPRRLAGPPGFPELVRPAADGRRLLLVVAGEHAEQADGLGSGTVGELAADETDAPDWTPVVETTAGHDEWRTTWLLDTATGESRQLSPQGVNTWEADWLGEDAAVAIVTDGPAEDAWYHARLVRIDLATGHVATFHEPDEWQIQFATGSPDGSTVAVIEGVASDRYYLGGELLLVAGDGSGARVAPTAAVEVEAVRWVDDARLAVLGREGLQVATGVATTGGEWRETWRGDVGEAGLFAFLSPLGTAGDVVTAIDGPDDPDRLVAIASGRARVILPTRRPVHDQLVAARAGQRAVEWTARDGTPIQAILRLPRGAPPYPTVLWVHGGPVAAMGWFPPSVVETVVLEAGYAIVHPNPRGSSGRGRAFAAAVVGDMGGEDAQDLLAGVEWLVAERIADPSRLAVAGISYGGYMAALLPTLTDRFAAAIVGSPLTDMVSSYYASSLTAFVRDYIGGDPVAETARYLERSPVFAGTRLRTPTLITNGARDRATPMGQSVELFRALREQGTDAELAIYPTEGHGFSDVATRGDWLGRMVAWLDRYMPARP
jgi:dipeptidyl aminopeptidase/acylaminoacyl peptidase